MTLPTRTAEEDARTRPLSTGVAEAIETYFSELNRLTEQVARTSLDEKIAVRITLPVRESGGGAPKGSFQRDVAVVLDSNARAVTRTERHDDRYDLDLNVSLSGLDEYEVNTVKRLLTEHLRSFIAAARQENSQQRIAQLLRAVAPSDPLADVELKVAEGTADLRREFLDEVPVVTSAQVHARAGFPGGNPSQTVHRWRKQGKLFAVNHGGRDWYPDFQFGVDGRPLPIIEELLAILRRDQIGRAHV